MKTKRKIIHIDQGKCDGCALCIPSCVEGAIRVVDGKARLVEDQYCDGLGACLGECPKGALAVIEEEAEAFDAQHLASPKLMHWPVQIRLVSPTAPILKGAELLVAADCTPVAYPHFHRDLLKGKVVLLGCPKFDDVQGYVQKFKEIFETADIRSVTVVVMEVPCCRGLPMLVSKAMNLAHRDIPLETVVISTSGKILRS